MKLGVGIGIGNSGALTPYSKRITSLFGSALLAYYPLDETSGTVANDISGNGRHGAYVGSVALNSTPSPIGAPAPLLTNGYVNIYSAALAAAFNGNEGACFGWGKSISTTWNNSIKKELFYLSADANNLYQALANNTNNNLKFDHKAGGTLNTFLYLTDTPVWFPWTMSWSNAGNYKRFYMFGSLVYSTTFSVAWAGTPVATGMRIGLEASNLYWQAYMAGVGLLNRPITYAESKAQATATIPPKRLSIIGESLSATSIPTLKWCNQLGGLGYNSGHVGVINHATAGHAILTNMAAQATACANDNADLIIMALGTNDNDAGNMTTIQGIVEAAIDTLRASNPNATIKYLNILNKWTAGGAVIDMSHLRAAILAACTAKGIRCFDVPINFEDTTDGTHLTSGGDVKVAAGVFAEL